MSPRVTVGIERINSNTREARALVGRFVGVSFGVTDIRRTYRELRAAGVAFDGPPEGQPWGGTIAHLRDPAGNVLTLFEVSR